MQTTSPLSNTVGSVLDPIIALRRTSHFTTYGTAIIDLVVGVTESRETALAQVEKYQSSRMTDRVFDLAVDAQPGDLAFSSTSRRRKPSFTDVWRVR